MSAITHTIRSGKTRVLAVAVLLGACDGPSQDTRVDSFAVAREEQVRREAAAKETLSSRIGVTIDIDTAIADLAGRESVYTWDLQERLIQPAKPIVLTAFLQDLALTLDGPRALFSVEIGDTETCLDLAVPDSLLSALRALPRDLFGAEAVVAAQLSSITRNRFRKAVAEDEVPPLPCQRSSTGPDQFVARGTLAGVEQIAK